MLLAVVGAGVGAALAPSAHEQIGPLNVAVAVRPSVHPGVAVALPPVGTVHFDTHRAPFVWRATVASVDLELARRVLSSSVRLEALQARAPDELRGAAIRAALLSGGCALLGSTLLLALGTRSRHGVAAGLTVTLAAMLVLSSLTLATFDSRQLAQPRFTGLLSIAPYVQRRTETLAERLESYRSGLSDVVQSVTTLYAVGTGLSGGDPSSSDDVTTVLHVSDLHLNPIGYDLTGRLVRQFGVDTVVDSGDLSTWGSVAEASFVGRIRSLGVPYVFVRGNHDSAAIARAVARQPGAVVLDGQVRTVAGLRIAGIADPRNTPNEGPTDTAGKDAVAAYTQRLADVVGAHDTAHPDAPAQVAVVHDPTRLEPLLGRVPLVLAGHLHRRSVDERDGTRVMVEGSTGGAGLTSAGLRRLTEGDPVPLEATLLYFRRSGPDAGRLLAYDEVTVGGLGLTSVSIDRTAVPATEPVPAQRPAATSPPTPGSTAPGRAPGGQP